MNGQSLTGKNEKNASRVLLASPADILRRASRVPSPLVPFVGKERLRMSAGEARVLLALKDTRIRSIRHELKKALLLKTLKPFQKLTMYFHP